VHKNIAGHGGDPTRIFVMGHSAGAQLAALLCIDDRYLKAEGVPFGVLKGCVPVDGDTYDVPAMIMTAELRQTVHGLPLPTFGHRVKFGNDPQKHVDFSAVTHVAKGKGIPPFLILHVAGHPDVTAQARRLGAVLQAAEIPVHAVWRQGDNPHQTQRRPRSARRPGHAEAVQIPGPRQLSRCESLTERVTWSGTANQRRLSTRPR
jgi:arylformamidase